MVKLTDFEIDQDVAFQNPVVEDQVDFVVAVIEGDALLPGLETESMAQL